MPRNPAKNCEKCNGRDVSKVYQSKVIVGFRCRTCLFEYAILKKNLPETSLDMDTPGVESQSKLI